MSRIRKYTMADAQASMDTYTTRTGTTALLVNGYKFQHNKTSKITAIWKCLDKECLSRCSTNIEMTSLLRTPREHNHPAIDKFVISRDKIRASCKRRATKEINEKASKVVCTEINKTGMAYRDFKNLKNSVYIERNYKNKTQTTSQQGGVFGVPKIL
ncbi:hypothetical protein PoB_005097200 [Plakobranchus ocellatus]|uniref:FLYWCH-type domain-containing protein n=1 Tax=Plakobranchus ocellatus TaxID=259542 RepID=A0AAV4BZL2_9GAST|nr:hypothetical protein PoB_005097200 [Plakobranchus ocellatus]